MTPLAQTSITVQYVNPPKGKGPASVKDTSGIYWKVWTTGKSPIPLETFREGGTYSVAYKTEQYQGKDQHTIVSVENGQAEFTPHPAPSAVTVKPNGGPALTIHAKPASGYDDNPAKAERIFVEGALNRAIQNGKVDVYSLDELVAAIDNLRSAYQQTLGKAA